MPAEYRDQQRRDRILAGVKAGEEAGLDRTDMIVLLWAFKCVRDWTGKDSNRDQQWSAARSLQKIATKRGDTKDKAELEKIRRMMTDTTAGTLEAYAALGFARAAQHKNHSLTLWRHFEAAFMSEVYEVFDERKLRDARQFPRDREANYVFQQSEKIRLRLIYLRRGNDGESVSTEADRIFSYLKNAPFHSSGIHRPQDHPRTWKQSLRSQQT